MTYPPSAPPERDSAPRGQPPRLWLSALADGEYDALSPGTALWRDDAGARECWHLYHLIGDVLRSEDLASTPARDAAFISELRARLATEPVPLVPKPAPSPLPAAQRVRRLGWRAPAAVAAGFVAVAATLVLMRPGGGVGADVQLAGGPASVAGRGVQVVSNPLPSATGSLVAEGRMIRDARLDAYLRAHQAARGNSPAALPGGGLRSAEMLVMPGWPMLPATAAPNLRSASEPR